MLKFPLLNAAYRVDEVPPDAIFLTGARRSHILRGTAYAQVFSLCNGRIPAVEIIQQLEKHIPFPEALQILLTLESQGWLMEGEGDCENAADRALWHELGVSGAVARARLARTIVEIRETSGVIIGPVLAESLNNHGVSTGTNGTWRVVLTDDYVSSGLDIFNREALASGQPLLLANLTGSNLWIGPRFTPRLSACWECLAFRMQLGRKMETFCDERKHGQFTTQRQRAQAHPLKLKIGIELLAIEILKSIVCADDIDLDRTLLTFDPLAMRIERHAVVRRPQCRSCGTIHTARESTESSLLISDPTTERLSPEEFFETHAHQISPITGVIYQVGDSFHNSDSSFHVCYATHAYPLVRDDLDSLIRNIRSGTGGKGFSHEQAKASALGEAIERYSIGCPEDIPGEISATAAELGGRGLDLRHCLNFSPDQYAQREQWNRTQGGRLHVIPREFNENARISWVPVLSLTRHETRYIPAAYCYAGHRDTRNHFFCSADSNGCAAGSTRADALLRGVYELIERDAVALWWYNRCRRPKVNWRSFQLPELVQLVNYLECIEREFWVLDLTTDLKIPTFVAVSRRNGHATQDILIGAATNLQPVDALLGAVAELAQFLPAVLSTTSNAETAYNFPDEEAIEWWSNARIETESYLQPDNCARERMYSDFSSVPANDSGAGIRKCVETLKVAGLELFSLDHTQADLGVPVMRAIIPDLRHFWRRLGPGRLYNVPVQLGWLEKALREDQLNPYSIFF